MTLVNDTLIKLNIILLHVEPSPSARCLLLPCIESVDILQAETIKTNFTAALELSFLADNGNPGLAMHSSNKAGNLQATTETHFQVSRAGVGGVGGTCVLIIRGCPTVQHSSVVLPRLAAVCCCCKLRAGDLLNAPL